METQLWLNIFYLMYFLPICSAKSILVNKDMSKGWVGYICWPTQVPSKILFHEKSCLLFSFSPSCSSSQSVLSRGSLDALAAHRRGGVDCGGNGECKRPLGGSPCVCVCVSQSLMMDGVCWRVQPSGLWDWTWLVSLCLPPSFPLSPSLSPSSLA